MIHDPALLDRLEALPRESFDGQVYRATRLSLDPLAGSYNGGRWMARDVAAILYTSLAREGALAEIAFHWSQLRWADRPLRTLGVREPHAISGAHGRRRKPGTRQ